MDTRLIRTLRLIPMVSVLTEFHCTRIFSLFTLRSLALAYMAIRWQKSSDFIRTAVLLINILFLWRFIFTEQNLTNRNDCEFEWFDLVFGNRILPKDPVRFILFPSPPPSPCSPWVSEDGVRFCSMAESIAKQSNDWVPLDSIYFLFGFIRLTTPGQQ